MKHIISLLLVFTSAFVFSQTNITEAEVKSRIEGIREKLISGQSSFATAARLYSEDIDSAKNGGVWEFKKTSGDKDLDKIIARLKPDELSKPVKTRGAYHLLQLVETTPEKTKVLHILISYTE